MATQPKSQARHVFGPFEVDTSAGELRKSGVRLRLSGQPIQILLALLAHPGEVVTREQLREQVWGETTFVDFEHGLNAAMNKLRRALGDSAEKPQYIETAPGRGYRFIASWNLTTLHPCSLSMSLSFRNNGVKGDASAFGGGLLLLPCS
jgi:DNA-binding winged helix-turn-helix (wHTH) protein